MKAEINSTGTLKITAETGVERFALKQWWELWSNNREKVVLQVEYEEPLQAGAAGQLRGRDVGFNQK